MDVTSIFAVPAGRPEQILPVQTEQQKQPKPTTRKVRDAPRPRFMTDSMHISEEARARRRFEQEQRQVAKEIQRQKRAKEARKAVLAAELDPSKPAIQTESMGKCVAIAGRILRGDSVPVEDEEYLSNNAPQLYQQSLLMRQTGEEGEDRGSVLTEEDVVDAEAAKAMAMLRPELRKLLTSPLWEEEPDISPPGFAEHWEG